MAQLSLKETARLGNNVRSDFVASVKAAEIANEWETGDVYCPLLYDPLRVAG